MIGFSYSLDIAVRMLMLLAASRQLLSTTAMMESLALPYHNSVRVIKLLVVAGLIETQRGRSGGVRLLVDPAEITLRQIIEIIDGPINLAYCSNHSNTCPIVGSCLLQRNLAQLERKINGLFSEVSLSNLIEGGENAFAKFSP